MPTGAVNNQSTSKTVRLPHKLAETIEEIATRENRSLANTLVTILEKYVNEYDVKSKRQFGDAEDIKDKPGVKKKSEESAS